MPFKSEKQRKWMHANKPKMAKKWERYNKGGKVDNVPAMLTEGEFVIKKSSAQKIGYDVLEHMNSYGKIPVYDARKRSKK
jgi:hypothetical protein